MKAIIVIILSSIFVLPLQAGGWLQGKGKGYFKLGQSIIKGDQFYNGDGEITDIITVGVYQSSLYGELGLSKKLDGILYLPFVSRLTLNDALFSDGRFQKGDDFTSIGDAQIGLKYGIRQDKRLVISASLILGLPLGSTDGGESGILQTGDGEFNQMVMLEAGYSFNAPLYANVGIGINNRTKGFSEEFRATAEIGYEYEKKLIIAAKFATVQSWMNGEPDGSAGSGIFSNNLEYVSFGPEISYRITEKIGCTFSYQGASAGRHILAAPSYGFGLFLEVK